MSRRSSFVSIAFATKRRRDCFAEEAGKGTTPSPVTTKCGTERGRMERTAPLSSHSADEAPTNHFGREGDHAFYQPRPRVEARLRETLQAAGIGHVCTTATTSVNHDDDFCTPHPLVLVTGFSGCGKTFLTRRILGEQLHRVRHEPTHKRRWFHVQAKFDQVRRNLFVQEHDNFGVNASSPVIHALNNLVQELLDSAPDGKQRLVRAVKEASRGDTGSQRILVNLFPVLDNCVEDLSSGSSCTVDNRSSAFALSRTHGLTRRKLLLTRFFASCFGPPHDDNNVVLFIDDLQWADKESLHWLRPLIADLPTFHVVAACRGSEVNYQDDLSQFLRSLEDENRVTIREIRVDQESWSLDDVQSLIVQYFKVERSTPGIQNISEKFHALTDGDIFYLSLLIRTVTSLNILSKEEGPAGDVVSMHLDEDRLEEILPPKSDDARPDLAAFICNFQLSADQKLFLQAASCIGAEFDLKLVEYALKGKLVDSIASVVSGLRALGFIEPAYQGHDGHRHAYRFTHDKVQQAGIMLTTQDSSSLSEKEEAMGRFCLEIGQRIWASLLVEGKVDEQFDILAFLLRRGCRLITDGEERIAVAELFDYVGKKYLRSSNILTAQGLFEASRTLLPERPWMVSYSLMLKVVTVCTEAALLLGDLEETEKLSREIIEHAHSLEDRLPAETARIHTLGARLRLKEAIDCSILLLSEIGIKLPRTLVIPKAVLAYRATVRMLRQHNSKSIFDLPPMFEPNLLTAMHTLNLLWTYASIYRSPYTILVAAIMVQLSLNHGTSAVSSVGFGFFSFACLNLGGDPSDAYVYGQYALHLFDRFPVTQWQPRVQTLVYGFSYSKTLPIRGAVEPLTDAFRLGLAKGDIFCALHSFHYAFLYRIFLGEPLPKLLHEYIPHRSICAAYRQDSARQMCEIMLQYLDCLCHGSDDYTRLKGKYFDEDCVDWAAMPYLVSVNAFTKLLLNFTMGNYAVAEALYVRLLSSGINKLVAVSRSRADFAGTISTLRMVCSQGGHRRARMRRARNALRRLQDNASQCPENHQCLYYAVDGLYFFAQGESDKALARLERAEAWAERENICSDQAIVREQIAYILAEQDASEARASLWRAVELFEKWGAAPKVTELQAALNL